MDTEPDYKSMSEPTCAALGKIGAELGINEHEGGTKLIDTFREVGPADVVAFEVSSPPHAQANMDKRDAAFEAVRQELCKIQRYSFHIDSRGDLRRVKERSGNWIEFDAAHALFDPTAVDAAIKKG